MSVLSNLFYLLNGALNSTIPLCKAFLDLLTIYMPAASCLMVSVCIQASLQTLMAAQGQPPGMYGGQGMALAGLGRAGQQQQQSMAMMQLAHLSSQDMPGRQGAAVQAPQGQIMMPAGQSSTVVQSTSPPNLQSMGQNPQ